MEDVGIAVSVMALSVVLPFRLVWLVKMSKLKYSASACLIAIFLVSMWQLSFAGCRAAEELSQERTKGFVTIDQGYYEGEKYLDFPVQRPQLVILDDSRDSEFLIVRNYHRLGYHRYRVTEEVYNYIRKNDFGKYAVIIAYLQNYHRIDANIRIEDMYFTAGNNVYFNSFVYDPPQSRTRMQGTSTTYHAIKLNRNKFEEGQEYQFILLNQDRNEIARARGIIKREPDRLPSPVDFDEIGFEASYAGPRVLEKPELHVITSQERARDFLTQNQRPFGEAVFGILRNHSEMLLANNYGDNIMIALLDKTPAGISRYAQIKRISQSGSLVKLKAIFTDPSSQSPGATWPYQIIRIPKANLSQKGNLELILIDQSGMERGWATALIE